MRVRGFKAQAVLILTILAAGVCSAQTSHEWSGFYDEFHIRQAAVNTTLPIYPTDAVQRKIAAVVQVKIAINDQGQVARIKVNPGTYQPFKQAVVDAVDKWTFKLPPEMVVAGLNSISRLTFRFSIVDGEPLVQLYEPPPSAKDNQRLSYLNSNKERKEWETWEEVKPTPIQQ